MNIRAEAGTQVKYTGTDDYQVNWGSNSDPRGILVEGEIYTVESMEIHSWHTKVYLVGIEGKFNSCSFEDIEEENK